MSKVRNFAGMVALVALVMAAAFIGGLKTDAYQRAHTPYALGATWATTHKGTLAMCESEGLDGTHYSPGMWLKGCFDHATDR